MFVSSLHPLGGYRCVRSTLTCRKNVIVINNLLRCFCIDAKTWSVGGGNSKQFPVLGGAVRATPGPPKTPILGLPKSRPSPLQKCAKNGVFGRKNVHFWSICAQFCTKMTSFLRT